LINVQAGVALHLLDEQPDHARPALTNIKQASRNALQELRAALDVLRHGDDALRAPAPTLADLDALVAGVRASGLDVRVEGCGALPPVSAAVELAAYRIVQEALTNVTRHAQARSAAVRLGHSGDGPGGERLTIEVTDDGCARPPARRGATGERGDRPRSDASGNGLAGMRERAAALGGVVDAGPAPGGGFRVLAVLPIGRADSPT
jgi:signal transduction histidine kinase